MYWIWGAKYKITERCSDMPIIRHNIIVVVVGPSHPHRQFALVLHYEVYFVVLVFVFLVDFGDLGLVFSRRLQCLLVDGLVLALFVDVETLEETMEVQVLEVFRTERELHDDGLDVMVCEL